MKVRTITQYRPMIFSRHPSHNVLRFKTKNIRLLPYKSLVRLGSTSDFPDTVSNGGNRIEINTIQAIRNSASKKLMKEKFNEAGVKTAQWFKKSEIGKGFIENIIGNTNNNVINQIENLPYPIVAKHHYGSRGKGNTLIKSQAELETWMQGKILSNYIFEKFMNYAHEFRLHMTEEGCFYTCRKALKREIPQEEKWHFHDDTCVWLLEDNENFFKPNSWNDIISDCVKALKAIGADVLSFDVKVQNPIDQHNLKRPYQDYILLECNSASSMDNGTGELSICAKKYIEEIPKIILRKANK